MKKLLILLLGLLASGLYGLAAPAAPHTFEIGASDFLLDGKPIVIRCGEIHLTRVPREYWRDRLKACRAMGLNTICVYLFWNYYEWEEGKFSWDDADPAEFCRIAQEEGLWVLLRPGPYSCAEWEMGGLPWWLLKREGIQIRSTDPKFMEPAKRYLGEVGRKLAPLQVTQGGPILMVQAENEYGFFGNDVLYMRALHDTMRKVGFTVPLFACNPPQVIANGQIPELFQVVNFGSGPEWSFKELRKHQTTGPLMNGEFYPGWFDSWGRPHRTGEVENTTRDLEYMLSHRHSFSIYMAHGGTTFGLWAGADRPFKPDTSSYDYDAPISEAGWLTPKFWAIRNLMLKHLEPGEMLPEPPAAKPVAAIAPFRLTEVASLMRNLPRAQQSEHPLTFEQMNHGRGAAVYETVLPAGGAGAIVATQVHDFAWIYLDDKPLGVMDRRSGVFTLPVAARAASARLRFVVEAMGRINFGPEAKDSKGLVGDVRVVVGSDSQVLQGWSNTPVLLESSALSALRWEKTDVAKVAGAAFWRGRFSVERPADTFLDLSPWGKGVAWLNGHCLGRFWNIGPTQTMYCPGPWLKTGDNEVVVFDLIGPDEPFLAGLDKPILNRLRPDRDFSPFRRVLGPPDLRACEPLGAHRFAAVAEAQAAALEKPASGRYLCIEILNTNAPNEQLSSISEFDLLGDDGKPLLKSGWRVLWAKSEGMGTGDGVAENILDGQVNTCWSKDWGRDFPAQIVLNLGESTAVSGYRILARTGANEECPRDVRIYLSDSPFGLKAP